MKRNQICGFPQSHFDSVLIYGTEKGQTPLHPSACGYPVDPAPFGEKLFSTEKVLASLIKIN